jgi:hypothetical protein
VNNHSCGEDIWSKVFHWCSRSFGAAESPSQSHDPGSPDGQQARLLPVDTLAQMTSTEESSGGISVCPQTRGSSSTVTSPGTSTDALLGNPNRESDGLSIETSLETEALFQTPSRESIGLSTRTSPGMSTEALERTTTGESASSSIAALPVKTMEILFRTQTRESIVSLMRTRTSESETSLRRSPGSSMNTPTLEPLSSETSPSATTENFADSTTRTSLEKATESVARILNREPSGLLTETSGATEAGILNGSKERKPSEKSSGSSAETLHGKSAETKDRDSTRLSSGIPAESLVTIFPTRPLAETTHGRSAGSETPFGESPATSKFAVSGLPERAEEDSDKVLDSVLPASKPLRPALHETEATENLVSLEKSPRHGVSLGLVSTAALSYGRQSYKR